MEKHGEKGNKWKEPEFCVKQGEKNTKEMRTHVWVGWIQARQQTAFSLIGDAAKHVTDKNGREKSPSVTSNTASAANVRQTKNGRKTWKPLRQCSDFANVVQNIIEDEVWGAAQTSGFKMHVTWRRCVLNWVISCIGLLFLMVLMLFLSHNLLDFSYFCADCVF